jgi:hypothetical protein
MTTRRVEVSIKEMTGCGAARAAARAGSGDPRPAAVVPDPEDPRPAAVVPDPEDPGGGARTVTVRTGPPAGPGEVRASELAATDYSGFIIVRVANRCLGCDEGAEEPASKPGHRRREEPSAKTPEAPVCRRVRERIEHEAKLLECLQPDVVVGRPLCLGALAELVREHPPRPLVRSVAPDTLRELELRAARTWLPPLHSLTRYCRIEACHLPLSAARELVALLGELPWVDLAYLELAATDPQNAAAVFTYASQQFYLDDAPVGLGVRRLRAEEVPGGDGAGVRVIDLEQGWFLAHEDFRVPVPPPFYGANRPETDAGYRGDHGTAVLGELAAAADDDRGVEGFVPAADVRVVSHWDAETRSNGHVADAVVATVAVLAGLSLARGGPAPDPPFERGDVLLLEVQRGRLPAEVDHADFDAVRLASALGLVVVEAAGNGGFDLDRYRDETGQRILDRSDAGGFRESGAIVVGAARSALPHDRASFSCFGSRVDCYAWGDEVVTSGYGDLGGDGERDAYTRTFAGTSSASPMVAGVAAAVQAIAGAGDAEDRLAPRELRRALGDPATGTPQGAGTPGRIGVMPDVPAVARRLGLVPDALLADGAEAGGLLAAAAPAAGAAPALAVGAGGITLRLANRGIGTARAVRATVYAAELAPLVPPEHWRRVGTSAPVDLVQGNRSASAGPVPMPPDGPDPASYLVVLHHEPEPPPLPPGAPYFRFDDYLAFVRRHAQRSLAETPAPAVGQAAELRFLLAGTPDRPRLFDVELEQALPERARARLLVPRALAGRFAAAGFVRGGEETRTETIDGASRQVSLVTFRLPTRPRVSLSRLRLGGAAYSCRLEVSGLGSGDGASLLLRQLHRGEEVGRIAWRIG